MRYYRVIQGFRKVLAFLMIFPPVLKQVKVGDKEAAALALRDRIFVLFTFLGFPRNEMTLPVSRVNDQRFDGKIENCNYYRVVR